MKSMKKLGFTLIELLIVLALVGILSLIVYPSYNKHITRARRIYATSVLLDVAGRIEQYYVKHRTYEGVDLDNLLVDRSRYDKYYDIDVNRTEDGYILTAIPINAQAKDGTCGVLTLDQAGRRGVDGAGSVNNCWL